MIETRFQPGAFIKGDDGVFEVVKLCEDQNFGRGRPTIKHVILEKFNSRNYEGMMLSTAENRYKLVAPA